MLVIAALMLVNLALGLVFRCAFSAEATGVSMSIGRAILDLDVDKWSIRLDSKRRFLLLLSFELLFSLEMLCKFKCR